MGKGAADGALAVAISASIALTASTTTGRKAGKSDIVSLPARACLRQVQRMLLTCSPECIHSDGESSALMADG